MKNRIKNHGKSLLVAGFGLFAFAEFCLLAIDVFSASEATRRLIHETLAKYGISSGGKSICGTGKEAEYNKDTGIVKCKNDSVDDNNNCWDKESRLCKECPNGTVVSQKDYISCKKIECPEGYDLIEVKNRVCPEGFELKEFNNSCDADTYIFDEVKATNNYTTQSTNCQNVKTK